MPKIAPLIAIVALLACVPENDPVTVEQPPNLEMRATWQATLAGQTGFTAVTGTTQARDFGPWFLTDIQLSGAAANTQYSWRIFPGTCAAPGATQHGPVQAYPNLVTNAQGTAQITNRTISGPLNLEGSYNVRVSTVATPVRIVACGNLAH